MAALPVMAAATPTPVTIDNYVRAESDLVFQRLVEHGGIGRFRQLRTLGPLDQQVVPRPNRDTLYSTAVFDLDAGPVRITLPAAGKRYISLMIVDEDHYVERMVYAPGVQQIDRKHFPSRYALAAVRILVDPNDPADVAAATALQDAIKVEQAQPGTLTLPDWDEASRARIRDALRTLGETVTDHNHDFGARGEVDNFRHLIGTATAWGGAPARDAMYLNETPAANDGETVQRLTVPGAVPVDAFWSVTVYDRAGYIQPNALGAYSVNSLTARRNADGSATLQFGGCHAGVPNCLPITKGWNYLVRLYRPRPSVLAGTWTFPKAEVVK
ncbi:MAG: DUF1254 domain-containing protein [Sphingomonadales bacterium]|nr:DUF1254 domain-containing protein [Sphingomonadales bacterium]